MRKEKGGNAGTSPTGKGTTGQGPGHCNSCQQTDCRASIFAQPAMADSVGKPCGINSSRGVSFSVKWPGHRTPF